MGAHRKHIAIGFEPSCRSHTNDFKPFFDDARSMDPGWGVGARDQLEATSFCRLHGGGPCAVFYRAVDACAMGNCSGSGSCARSWIDTPRQDSSNCSVLAVSAQSECKRMAPSCEECDQARRSEFQHVNNAKMTTAVTLRTH